MQMPKTYKDYLNELEVGHGIVITPEKRSVWSTIVNRMNGSTKKQFVIRTNREISETRVWRLADAE